MNYRMIIAIAFALLEVASAAEPKPLGMPPEFVVATAVNNPGRELLLELKVYRTAVNQPAKELARLYALNDDTVYAIRASGERLKLNVLNELLKKPQRVLCIDGPPDPFYLDLIRPDTIVLIDSRLPQDFSNPVIPKVVAPQPTTPN